MIPYGRQEITESDIKAVVDVLRSDFITQGQLVPTFEKAVADYCEARYATAVNSGTSALHIACLALKLGPGDMLWTSPNTFVASANCALYCGSNIDFVDIDPHSGNMSVTALTAKLEKANANGTLPKIVVPVHFAGQSCDMVGIKKLADLYSFKIIEDACHAIGGRYKDRPVGNCRYSDITIFSFHPVKIITTGEGGMAITNDPQLAQKMSELRSHGIIRHPKGENKESNDPWYYEQIGLGFNYRMTDIQAALGLSQLERLDDYVARRHELAKIYDEKLTGLLVVPLSQEKETYSSYHLYVIRLKLDEIRHTRREIFEEMRKAGIGVNVHYIPVHTQPYYRKLGFKSGQFPETERYYTETITIPLFPTMDKEIPGKVVDKLAGVMK